MRHERFLIRKLLASAKPQSVVKERDFFSRASKLQIMVNFPQTI